MGRRAERVGYWTDLTDAQFALVAPFLPAPRPGGRPRTTDLRRVVDAVLYLLRAGCAWRLLPRDFPPWQTVYRYLRAWQADGTWHRLHEVLRRAVRTAAGRNPDPSVGIADSQTVRTTERGDPVATTRASASAAASATSWWTASAC
jgi:putative transposase